MDTKLYKDILNSHDIAYSYNEIIFDTYGNTTGCRILECNQVFADIVEARAEELKNQHVNEINNSIISAIYKNVFIKNIAEPIELSTRFQGEFYDINISAAQGGTFLITVKKNPFDLESLRFLFRNVCNRISANLIFAEIDSGRIFYANKSACDLYGYTSDELLQKTIYDITLTKDETLKNIIAQYNHKDKLLSLDELISYTAKSQKNVGYFMQHTKSGRLIDVIMKLSIIGMCGSNFLLIAIQDRTHIYKMTRYLEENEKQYRTIFDEAPVGYQTLDIDAKILTVNKQWLKMFGYTKKEVIGKCFFDFATKKGADALRLHRKRHNKSPLIDMKFEMIKKDGSIIPVRMTGKTQSKKESQNFYCQCMLFDITENIKAKEKEIAMQKAKNDFLAVISHEIRTPLTTILGINELMKNTALNKEQRKYVQQISVSGKELLGILNDMLDITKYESGKLHVENLPFCFEEFIQNMVAIFKMHSDKNGNKFRCEIDENIPNHLIGDSMRLGQILKNILTNANKFTHKGKIKLRCRLMGRTKDFADVQIIVRDTGIGMTKEELGRLFTPFEQASASFARKYGGSGLGMAISKQLIDLMGGSIKAESIYGEGTIFIINLSFPIDNSPKEILELVSDCTLKKEYMSRIAGKRVLVAEDHKINQKIICDILKHYDLSTDVANNGMEAIKKAKNNRYDLILMDIQMPKVDGLCAARTIRSMDNPRAKNTPILAMTAHAMKEEYAKSLNCGMNGHLTKPINIQVLEEHLIKYLAGLDIAISNPQQAENTESEDIDVRMGLIRFNHDADAYKSSLKDFLTYKSADKKLIKMLKKNDTEKAMQYLHSIKGIAGNLSINNLSSAAHELKQYLSSAGNVFREDDVKAFTGYLKTAVMLIENRDVIKQIDFVMERHVKR